MLSVRLPEDMESRLTKLADKTGRTKNYYVNKAIAKFLDEQEDYLLALQRLEEQNPRISLEEVKKLIDMDD